MEEKKFVQLKKDEYGVKEFIKKELGKGKISSINIEYTPIGEKITITTNKPGFVIGRKGERITDLTEVLKKKFNLENPHIEINEISKPEFDAQSIADEIAMSLERFGSLRF
jgi:small subunit ribosomal protein S3